MCLITFETEANIAEKDITVYKKIKRVKRYKHLWKAPIRGTTHPFNKILKGTDKLRLIPMYVYAYDFCSCNKYYAGYQKVMEGFHAYTGPDRTCLAKAIIPKGSEYVKGDKHSLNEIVANNMIVFSSNWQYFLWKLGFRKRFK